MPKEKETKILSFYRAAFSLNHELYSTVAHNQALGTHIPSDCQCVSSSIRSSSSQSSALSCGQNIQIFSEPLAVKSQQSNPALVHVHRSIILNSIILKCPPIDERISKMWSIHTIECHPAFKRKEVLTHVITMVNPQDIPLSEVSQSPEAKDCNTPVL